MKDWNRFFQANEELDNKSDVNKIVNYLAKLEISLQKNGLDLDFNIQDDFDKHTKEMDIV